MGLDVLCDKDGDNGVRIAYVPASGKLKVGSLGAPFELKPGEDLTLRVFIDKNLVEVFANDRQAAVTTVKYAPENLGISLFSKGADCAVKQLKSWKMKSIYAGPVTVSNPLPPIPQKTDELFGTETNEQVLLNWSF